MKRPSDEFLRPFFSFFVFYIDSSAQLSDAFRTIGICTFSLSKNIHIAKMSTYVKIETTLKGSFALRDQLQLSPNNDVIHWLAYMHNK